MNGREYKQHESWTSSGQVDCPSSVWCGSRAMSLLVFPRSSARSGSHLGAPKAVTHLKK